ncbi:MAG: EscG/YscG/SsaH family type III secretion system needle protein co-chaperone [Ottowia sp.]|nr:EscG/YscG/SsaH family type III secretion system needle protein co-chaperone [Ottowia sp.]
MDLNNLDADCRRLIVQAGLAAVNHGLYQDAEAILNALPLLVSDTLDCALLRACLLFGLNRVEEAMTYLDSLHNEQADALKAMLQPNYVTVSQGAKKWKLKQQVS